MGPHQPSNITCDPPTLQAWRPTNEQEREERWNGRMDRTDAWDRREDRDLDRKQISMIIFYVFFYIDMYSYVYIYIYIHIHIHTHKYIYICMYVIPVSIYIYILDNAHIPRQDDNALCWIQK